MFIKKSTYRKLVNDHLRVKELEEIICPCEQHKYVVADTETTYPYMGGPSVEILNKRKLICKKCKKVVYDYDGCGHTYCYQTVEGGNTKCSY